VNDGPERWHRLPLSDRGDDENVDDQQDEQGAEAPFAEPQTANQPASVAHRVSAEKIPGHSQYQRAGGVGRGGFGPNARAVSRWGRFVRDISRWRASSVRPCSA